MSTADSSRRASKDSGFHLDQPSFLPEQQRRMEQLVLYEEVLSMLQSCLLLAKQEIKCHRLKTTAHVVTSELTLWLLIF